MGRVKCWKTHNLHGKVFKKLKIEKHETYLVQKVKNTIKVAKNFWLLNLRNKKKTRTLASLNFYISLMLYKNFI